MPVLKENKPPEVLQAQMAAYAAEAQLPIDDRALILNNLGSVATMAQIEDLTAGSMLDVTEGRARERIERLGQDRVLLGADGYVEFLRRSGGSSSESIRGRAELLSRYEEFAPQIDVIKAKASLSDEEQRPSPVGEGANSKAYPFFHDGQEYIAIIPNHKDERGTEVDDRVRGLVKAHGIDGLEQGVAASTEEGVIISERIPGVPLNEIPLATLESISQEAVDRVLSTIVAACQKGVEIDYVNAGNFLYSEEKGFGIVDISEAKGKPDLRYHVERLVAMFASLTSLEAQDVSKPKEEVFAAVMQAQVPKMELLNKLEKSLRKQFSNAEERGFVELVQEQVETQKRSEKYLATEYKIGS